MNHIALRMYLREAFLALLADPAVSEIYCNPDLILRSDGAQGRREHGSLDEKDLAAVFQILASDAGLIFDAENPIADFRLPTFLGSGRLNCRLPPVVDKPSFNLRKRPEHLLLLPELVERQTISKSAAEYLAQLVVERKSVLIAGPTNSGKTNFLNALLHAAVERGSAAERWAILEDIPEIRCPAKDHVVARTGPNVSLWDLVRATMRFSPDRIVVGELRGPEAYPCLDIAASGHPGILATLHAETPLGALLRLDRLARLASPDLPHQHELIAEVITAVVCLTGGSAGRKVSAIAEVTAWHPASGYTLVHPPAVKPDEFRKES